MGDSKESPMPKTKMCSSSGSRNTTLTETWTTPPAVLTLTSRSIASTTVERGSPPTSSPTTPIPSPWTWEPDGLTPLPVMLDAPLAETHFRAHLARTLPPVPSLIAVSAEPPDPTIKFTVNSYHIFFQNDQEIRGNDHLRIISI